MTKRKKQTILFLIVIFLVATLLVFWLEEKNFLQKNTAEHSSKEQVVQQNVPNLETQNTAENELPQDDAPAALSLKSAEESADVSQKNKTVQDVPFVVQAPFANWKDPLFQNACEETSMIMAMGWVNGNKTISPKDAETQIKNIAKFEDKIFGFDADTDVFAMQRIFKEYFQNADVTIKENIGLDDIKKELYQGNIVLVPAFGQALKNPNYTAPGPIAHMLVIIGYDPTTKKFITNDSGTKNGAGYQYDENVLFGAIWKYPSGKGPLDPPSQGKIAKAMIIVQAKEK